jgi:hypothetical protein
MHGSRIGWLTASVQLHLHYGRTELEPMVEPTRLLDVVTKAPIAHAPVDHIVSILLGDFFSNGAAESSDPLETDAR